ncbi:hypothetical protein IE4771_PB00186 (plasmid) [Rhizobium etli bv. mimosae str. IE4771]|uniref:Uncharacterized protein n=1 Tax=Rhizobium etli bv. mimosae str. IE4771 TaxID=1432050 RepID=A0A060I7R3_RHIET|nr:hypothetical protein IE4771_PB00186 [Rhizobium sp. IE4771]
MERQIFLNDTSCMMASPHPASHAPPGKSRGSFSHADCQVTASAVVMETSRGVSSQWAYR